MSNGGIHSDSIRPALIDPADQREIDELNRLVEQQRRSTSACRVGARELRVMLVFCGSMMLLMTAAYVFLPVYARLVTTYIADVALVLSGWGVYRSMRADKLQPHFVATFYEIVFALLAAFYLIMLLCLTHVFDPAKWVK